MEREMLTKSKLVEIIKKMIDAQYSDEETTKIVEMLYESGIDAGKMLDIIYWDERNWDEITMSPEEIADEVLNDSI